MDREEAIAFIQECRQIHVDWADYQDANPNWEEETPPSRVGDADHHREWVGKYDRVLDVLKGCA